MNDNREKVAVIRDLAIEKAFVNDSIRRQLLYQSTDFVDEEQREHSPRNKHDRWFGMDD